MLRKKKRHTCNKKRGDTNKKENTDHEAHKRNQQSNNYLPDFEKCPAPSSHLKSRRLLSVFVALNFATNLAGSEYKTRGSAT